VATEAALSGIEYEILSVLAGPEQSQVRYKVTLKSLLVGDISRETVMNLRREKGDWRIQWDDTLVLPELKGGNYLVMDRAVRPRGPISTTAWAGRWWPNRMPPQSAVSRPGGSGQTNKLFTSI
jgi:penicillin-binding protein 2